MVKEDSSLLENQHGQVPDESEGGGGEKNRKGCKSRFPPSILFILATEFVDCWSFYGMKTVLVLYLTRWLMFSEDSGTALYHAFTMLGGITPLFGAIIADSYLGRYKAILYGSIIYFFGSLLMATTALPPPEWYGPAIALMLITIGSGGIRPCVAAFGGDQFAEGEEEGLEHFFPAFYFIVNVGSLLSMLITPVIRENVQCAGGDCYAVVFGIPAVLMLFSIILFRCGRDTYRIYLPAGNIVCKICASVWSAIRNRCKSSRSEKKSHWLDYADEKYDEEFMDEVKGLMSVLVLLIPAPIFWALFDQQGSRWTLQATQLNGDLGNVGHLQPDQLQALNPVFIIILLPVFEVIIYPLLDRCKIPHRPLQRMVAGMLLASSAFIVAGFLQLRIESSMDDELPNNQSKVSFINAAPCQVLTKTNFLNATLSNADDIAVDRVQAGTYDLSLATSGCGLQNVDYIRDLSLEPDERYYTVISQQNSSLSFTSIPYTREYPKKGGALIGVIYEGDSLQSWQLHMENIKTHEEYDKNISSVTSPPSFTEVHAGRFDVRVFESNGSVSVSPSDMEVASGGMYIILLQTDVSTTATSVKMSVHQLELPNQISMLQQIPQYILLTSGEVVFSVTALSFAYSEAPPSMKSVLQAAWAATISVGNLIVVFVAEVQVLKQALEYFLFAILMAIDAVLFGILAYSYTYAQFGITTPDITPVNKETDKDNSSKPEDESNL